MLKYKDNGDIADNDYAKLISMAKELGSTRGRIYSEAPKDWECIMNFVFRGLIQKNLLKHNTVHELMGATPSVMFKVLFRESKGYMWNHSNFKEDKERKEAAFKEFCQDHLITFLKTIAQPAKRFYVQGNVATDKVTLTEHNTPDVVQTYKNYAWLLLAVLNKDPSVKIKVAEKETTLTLMTADLTNKAKTDNAVLTDKTLKVLKVLTKNHSTIYKLYGELVKEGTERKLFIIDTVAKNSFRHNQFSNNVPMLAWMYAPNELANADFSGVEEDIQRYMNYANTLRARQAQLKALIPVGGVPIMFKEVFEHMSIHYMDHMNEGKSHVKELAMLFSEGLTVERAEALYQRVLKEKQS